MTFVAVLPSIFLPYTQTCVASMGRRFNRYLLVVDNTVRNRGVSAAWNDGVRAMRDRDADWLVIVSAAVRFGKPGGDDFLAHLDDADPDAWAVEAGECPRWPGNGFGWHLIGFRSSTFDRVGTFDENFFAYWEDCDFGHRIRTAHPQWRPGPDPLWPKVPVDADLASYAHGVKLADAQTHPERLRKQYISKWGGPPAHEVWWRPFNDETKDVRWWPRPPDPRSILANPQPGVGWPR